MEENLTMEATLTNIQTDIILLEHKLTKIQEQVTNLNIAVAAITYIPIIEKQYKTALNRAIEDLNSDIASARITAEDYNNIIEKTTGERLDSEELAKQFSELKENIATVIEKTRERK